MLSCAWLKITVHIGQTIQVSAIFVFAFRVKTLKFFTLLMSPVLFICIWCCSTVKSELSERRLSETTGLFKDDVQSPLFSLLSIAIKLPIIRISIIRKIQFFEVICRSRLKKMLLNYPSRFEVQMSRMVIMISLFGRVRFTHLSNLEKKVETGN